VSQGKKAGTTGDSWVQDQKQRYVEYEVRKRKERLVRLIQGKATAADFVDYLFDTVDQVCGVRQQAPRDRGAETIQRFEGGRDVGLYLENEGIDADPTVMARGNERALKRVRDRARKFQQIEAQAAARRGETPPTDVEIPE
jgi:hypothetical protein